MRSGVEVRLNPGDRERLEAVVGDRNSLQKHVWRAEIVLLTADGLGTNEIASDGQGADLRRGHRHGHRENPPETPPEATHWTVRDMAKVMGISVSTVQKIWRAHGLAPHRIRQFKLSNDVAFVDKLQDVVGPHCQPAGTCGGAVDG